MYADRPMLRRGPQPVSFGASLIISSGIVAALIFVAPDAVKLAPSEPIDTFDVKDQPPPPPEPLPKPETLRQTEIVAPTPLIPPIPTTADPIRTTEIIREVAPPILPGTLEGTGATLTEPKPLPLVGASLDPRYARDLQPEYPGSELRSAREGLVTVRVRIGTDGRVKAVEKVRATSDAFFEATRRQALARWRFKPATRGGIPEESWKQMSVRFELKN